MAELARGLDRFYSVLERLAQQTGGPRLLARCTGRDGWPLRGIYVVFEPRQVRSDGVTPRAVRVGTHALTVGSSSTLWGRLRQHRGTRAGGGNHRGSVFRRHVGGALLNRDGWRPEAATWGKWASASREVREREQGLERDVSRAIGAMSVLWVAVTDQPGPESERGTLERNLIALLSAAHRAGLDPPTDDWLGHHANAAAIRRSGLWNVNHIDERHDPKVLDLLETSAARTPSQN